nr:immunoglobulin heavy chain junction region [Mus musculus]
CARDGSSYKGVDFDYW